MRFVLVALLLAVVAGEYDACTRPDAVYASWDQAFSRRTPAHTPCATALILPSPPCATATLMRRMLMPTMPRGQGHGTSYAYGGIESGDNIYIIGRACASPSRA